MITIKTGVPGSGKTQSMVSELMAMVAKMKKSGEYRPIYTNITGLDAAVIPHFKMTDTKDWQSCPPESLIVIDEAQENGYEAMSMQKAIPEYISKLAVHRKDYSVDFWFISQHPKLLHVALRRQCGKHQHYERKFGFKRALCFEWHHCEDQLSQRKTAIASQFVFDKRFQAAYHSADVHTKQKFKFPLWLWVPLAAIPLGIFAAPMAYHTLSGAATGKGVGQDHPVALVGGPPVVTVENGIRSETVVAKNVPASGASAPVAGPYGQAFAGCMSMRDRCQCLGQDGRLQEVTKDRCEENVGQSGHDVPYLVSRQNDQSAQRISMPETVRPPPLIAKQ